MTPVILGAGLAGLTAALSLAPRPVKVIVAGRSGTECSTAWAQGGIAAAVGEDDNPDLHAEDTRKAGAGLCAEDVVRQVTLDGARVIERLVNRHVAFDRDTQGKLLLGLEAAHSRRRIVHAQGDATGAVILKTLLQEVRNTPSVEVIENTRAIQLVTVENEVRGVCLDQAGRISFYETSKIVLATGGVGALWQYTTNPLDSWGSGLALAARAGADLGDLEFVQFHPTAINKNADPMPLASETLRGEGALLIDEQGVRFMEGVGRAELEPRDVVARAIWKHILNGHQVFLDTRLSVGAHFPQRFPSIYKLCMSLGIDPVKDPIPVAPAAHYHMGGVVTDDRGRTSVKGLWACGEVASTGLHGANRLASNSLLEAASLGQCVAEDIHQQKFDTRPPVLTEDILKHSLKKSFSKTSPETIKNIRKLMSEHVGVLRHASGLKTVLDKVGAHIMTSDRALVAAMISLAALRREESRGAQARLDFPLMSPAWAHRQILTLKDVVSDPLIRSAQEFEYVM